MSEKIVEFKVGDRVKVTKDYDAAETGMIGTIVSIPKFGHPGIEFDEFMEGHDCSGASKSSHGQWVPVSHLETTKEEESNMNISDNIAEVFESSTKTAKKVAARFGDQYGNTDRDLLALKRDKPELLAIIAEEEKEAKAEAKKKK